MKNPWLSLWLSSANRIANTWGNTVRGHWMAEWRRQQAAALRKAGKPPARRRKTKA